MKDTIDSVTTYVIKNKSYFNEWTTFARIEASAGTAIKVSGLIAGTFYQFRVLAENEFGISKPSNITNLYYAMFDQRKI